METSAKQPNFSLRSGVGIVSKFATRVLSNPIVLNISINAEVKTPQTS